MNETAQPDLAPSPPKKALVLGLIAVGLLAMAPLHFLDPTTSGLYPPCLFHWLTGLHCPGCGTGRAVHALLNGDILQALAFNGLSMLFLPVAGFCGLRRFLHFWRGTVPPTWILPPRLAWAVFGVILAFGVLRNLPFEPFILLAPHVIGGQ